MLPHLEACDVCTAALTCRTLRDAAREETLWSMVYRQRWGDQPLPAGESYHVSFYIRHRIAQGISEQRMISEQREAYNKKRRVA